MHPNYLVNLLLCLLVSLLYLPVSLIQSGFLVFTVCADSYSSAALAEEASKIAATYNDVLSAKILDEEQCKELKMGSYLGVAAASANPPHFIHLCYKPPSGPVKVKLGLVGKGLTFDR